MANTNYEVVLRIRVGSRQNPTGDLDLRDPAVLAEWKNQGVEILTDCVDETVGRQYRGMGGQFEILEAKAA